MPNDRPLNRSRSTSPNWSVEGNQDLLNPITPVKIPVSCVLNRPTEGGQQCVDLFRYKNKRFILDRLRALAVGNPELSVYSFGDTGAVSRSPRRSVLLAASAELQRILERSELIVEPGLLHGHPAEELANFANMIRPDLIIVGAKGLHVRLGIFLGGTAQHD